MSLWDVTVAVEVEDIDVEVEADTEDEAIALAIKEAMSGVLTITDASVDTISEVPE